MSTKPTTPKYGLIKPTQDDFYDVEDHNKNMDALEVALLAQEAAIKNINLSWEGITDKPTQFPPIPHNHPASQITGLPTSLPANGGNADTVGGLQPWLFGTLSENGTPHGVAHVMTARYNVKGDARFYLKTTSNECRVDMATYSAEANNTTLVQGRNLCSEFDILKSSVVGTLVSSNNIRQVLAQNIVVSGTPSNFGTKILSWQAPFDGFVKLVLNVSEFANPSSSANYKTVVVKESLFTIPPNYQDWDTVGIFQAPAGSLVPLTSSYYQGVPNFSFWKIGSFSQILPVKKGEKFSLIGIYDYQNRITYSSITVGYDVI